jgi:hypothetical protein
VQTESADAPIVSPENRQRALEFVKEWKGETREQAEAKPFWVDFFAVFGIKRRRVAAFEQPRVRCAGQLGHANISTTRLYDKRKSRPEDGPTFKVEY